MFSSQECFLCEFLMRVVLRAYNDKVDICVGKELTSCTVVFGFWIINGAMSARSCTRLDCRSFSSLQKGVYFEIGDRKYEGKMKAFDREAIAHKPYIDRSHFKKPVEDDTLM